MYAKQLTYHRFDIRIVIRQPRHGESAYTPRIQYNILAFEAQLECILHHGVRGGRQLFRIGQASALRETRIIPAECGEAILDGYLKNAHFVEGRVAIATNHQVVTVVSFTAAAVCRV